MSAATARLGEAVRDLDIEQWIQEQFGFVPHPFWISHCKELYLEDMKTPDRARRLGHECPVDKRSMIREAFVYFGMLPK
jgi:hypothetical protein